MSGSRPTVNIRLSAEGAEKVRRDIESLGPAGQKAFEMIQRASALAQPEMQKLGTSIDVVQRAFIGMGGSLGRFGSVFTGVAGVAGGLTTGFVALGAAATLAGVSIAKAGDEATATLARLTSATGGLSQAQAVYENLFRLSQQTGVAVAESAGSFSRFSVAAKEIGATNDQVLKLVSGIQKAGIVAGASAQETGAAVQQIGQALASGKLQGDELRSLLENMPQLAQALAKELGVGIGQLRQMGSEGKLTADTVFPALLRASEKMGAEFDKMPVTMTRAKDVLIAATEDFGARLDRITGLSRTFAGFMQQGAAALNAAGRLVAPTEREAADQSVAAAERLAGQVRAQITAERAASAYGDVSPGLAEAARIAEENLRAALARQAEIRREDRELQRAEAQDAATQAREAARTNATIRLKDTAADLDAQYKARQAYADKIKKLDEDEARGGTLPAGVTFDSLRAAAAKELAEALEKVAGSHAKVAKEAKQADDHVKEYLKDQEKAAEAVAKAQEKAAEAIRRYHERSFEAVLNIGERAFDRLGDSLVDAFVRGEGASVNFGNVLRAVISSALADIAKLAIVNPVLNSVFTSSQGARPTLAGAFGGMPTSLGGGFGIPGLGALLPTGGLGGMMTSANSYLFGTTAGPLGEVTSGLLGSGGSMSLGALGAGFGTGMFANSMLGGNQLGGGIGSGVGSLAGMALGSLVGMPFLGAMLGGAAGGGLGGLFGPGPSSNGFSYALRSTGADDGWSTGTGLRMTDQFYNEQGRAQFEQANAAIAQINAFMAAQGLNVWGARSVGGNKNGMGNLGYGEAASFGEAFGSLNFGSASNAGLNAYLSGKSFDDPAKLQAAVEGFKAIEAVIANLTAEAVPAFTTQLKAVNDNFDAAATEARKYGLAEDGLTAARGRAVAALEDQRAETLRQSEASLAIRLLTAQGQTQEAELARQTEAARMEVEAFGDSLDALALGAEDRAARLVALEEVQAAERAAIIARFGEQAANSLRSDLAAGQSLLRDLAFGGASALAPEQQYFAALSTLNQARRDLDAGGSLANYSAIAGQVLPVARDFLGTSQRYAGLAAEVGQVLASKGADGAGLAQMLNAQAGGFDALANVHAAIGDATVGELRSLRTAFDRMNATLEALITRRSAA